MANIVVQTNVGNKNWKTVNIVAAAAPKGGKGHNQIPIAQNVLKQYAIYQPTASPVAGLQTIYISGYSGPA